MGLSAWEQRALDSIKSGIAGSDPELAALLCSFTRLASGEDMPDQQKAPAGLRRSLRRLRRARRRSGMRTVCHRLGSQRVALLALWLLTTAVLIAVVLVPRNSGQHSSTCTETIAVRCAGPDPGHSPGSASHSATTGQAPQQGPSGITQAGP